MITSACICHNPTLVREIELVGSISIKDNNAFRSSPAISWTWTPVLARTLTSA